MKITFSLLILLVSLSTPLIFAHEGHNHDAPTTIKAPKGGTVKELDEAIIELIYKGKDIKIYFYDKSLKPLANERFQIKAMAIHPRTKKEDPITFSITDAHYHGIYDAKGIHRYSLKLNVLDKNLNVSVDVTFTIEPRK